MKLTVKAGFGKLDQGSFPLLRWASLASCLAAWDISLHVSSQKQA